MDIIFLTEYSKLYANAELVQTSNLKIGTGRKTLVHLSAGKFPAKRVREDIKQWNQMLAETAHKVGVITNEEFAIFQNAGYMGLYG